jgi:hypothetical protein
MEYSTRSLLLKPITIRSLVVILNANGNLLAVLMLMMVIAVPFCSHWLICTNLKAQINKGLSGIIHHMVQFLMVEYLIVYNSLVVLIFVLSTHQTPMIVLMLISVIFIKMMSTTLMVSLNHGNSFQVVILINLVRSNMKYMEWHSNETR